MIQRSLTLFGKTTLRPLVSRHFSLSVPTMIDRLPPLMEFPPIASPKISHSLRNWFISQTLIPYFDNDFSNKEFGQGAKQAAVTVANDLAEGEFDNLTNYLTPECLATVQKSIRYLTIFKLFSDVTNFDF